MAALLECEVMDDCVPEPPHSSTQLLQTCNRDSPSHLCWHPLDHLIKMVSPVWLRLKGFRNVCLSDLAGWRTATRCQAKTPFLHIITALQDSLCTKSHKCSICRTKREHKNHYFHILIPWKKLPPSTALFSLKGITCIFLHYKKLNLCILPASDKLSHAATDKGCSEIKICDSYKYIMKQLAKHYKN